MIQGSRRELPYRLMFNVIVGVVGEEILRRNGHWRGWFDYSLLGAAIVVYACMVAFWVWVDWSGG